MTQFNSLATLRRRQCAPEAMDTRGRHLSKILDVLRATKLDLKERRVVIDVERLELPEHDGGIFRAVPARLESLKLGDLAGV